MGYNKIIRYADIIETYTYDRQLPIRSGARRGISRRNALGSVDHDGDHPLSPQEFEGKRKDNAMRASMVFRRLVAANLDGAHHPLLLTLTYKDNETSLKAGYKDFGSFIQALRYKYGKVFRYIAVPEFQKRGAVHFHALFWDLPDSTFETERQTRTIARLWGHGFVYMKMTDGNQRLSSYLTKYMAKSFTDHRLMNQKAYVRSRNLIKPVIASVSNFGLDAFLDEAGAGTPEIDKSYDTHWLGRGRHRIYKIIDENNSENLS
jgi:hypothetical protein